MDELCGVAATSLKYMSTYPLHFVWIRYCVRCYQCSRSLIVFIIVIAVAVIGVVVVDIIIVGIFVAEEMVSGDDVHRPY